jgi:error-prone DNA polymerase
VQRSAEGVMHLMANRIVDLSALLDGLGEEVPIVPVPRARHPRDVRIIPKSRDFH